MKSKFIFFFLFCNTFLFGGIEQYFKKPTDKTDLHRMRNIDFIYTLNLDQRPEKFESCTKQLHPYGIYPYRFSAVNGWELPLKVVDALGIPYEPSIEGGHWGTYYPVDGDGSPQHEIISVPGRVYFCHCMSRGAIGIVLSHLSILQDALDSGYETIWVMEDDIEIIQDPHLLSTLTEKLDAIVGSQGWDILFTDRDTKNQQGVYVPCLGYAWRPYYRPLNSEIFQTRRQISNDFRRVGARYGAYSMIVRRSGMVKILNFLKQKKVFLPYDMEFYLPPGMKIYSVLQDVVSTQKNALSDNGEANYKRASLSVEDQTQ